GANQATCCWADGNNRPPPNGAACGIVNTQTGQASTKKIVVKAQRGGNGTPAKYQNQVSLAKLDANVCGLGHVQSNGAGKNNNRGGTNVSRITTIDCSTLAVLDTTPDTLGVASFQRHATLQGTKFGSQGTGAIAISGLSSTGSGVAS